MKVTILEPNGYCTGVERAMNLAFETKKKSPSKNVVILGMLVHNANSLKALEKQGINTIFKENISLEEQIKMIKEPSIVILTAHGHSKKVEDLLIKNHHEIVDATCPFVRNSFVEISKAIKNGQYVFYIGVENHPEAIAALSISEKVIFVNAKTGEIPNLSCDSPMVISQTTLSNSEITNII